ncbi:hypothetical protein, partial [Klebsiella variicola]|uniref:hypothetical protein n=1 Tax=Klebsiella variicola TaxID=244366 RepID=UPI001953DBF4
MDIGVSEQYWSFSLAAPVADQPYLFLRDLTVRRRTAQRGLPPVTSDNPFKEGKVLFFSLAGIHQG